MYLLWQENKCVEASKTQGNYACILYTYVIFYQNHSGMSWAQGTNKNVDQKFGLKAYIFNNISLLNKDHYKTLLAPLLVHFRRVFMDGFINSSRLIGYSRNVFWSRMYLNARNDAL